MAATPGIAEDNNDQNVPGINEDPYIWLKKPGGLRWVNTENERTLSIMEQDLDLKNAKSSLNHL